MHLQTIGTRSMRPVQTANTALPFTPARSPSHCDAHGFVHPTVALTHCNWYHPVERVREHAHLSPSPRLRHAVAPTVERLCHPAFAGTSVPSRRLGSPTLPAVSHSPSCHYSDYTHRYFILRTRCHSLDKYMFIFYFSLQSVLS